MLPVEPLIDFQSNAPGLPGLYLVENMAPYRFFDQLGQRKPRTLLMIGGRCKRQCIASSYLVHRDQGVHDISIACLGNNTILLDAELHLKDRHALSRFQEKRPIGGGYRAHLLEHTGNETNANHIYANVLSLFSDIIVIFVPDFGLTKAVGLLCSWTRLSRFHITRRVVFVHRTIPENIEISNRLMACFASELRRTDPLRSYTNVDIRQMIEYAFCITNVSLDESMWDTINETLDQGRTDRIDAGIDLSAHQIKYLLQGALKQYAQEPMLPFDLIRAMRYQDCPEVPSQDAIRAFLQGHRPIGDSDLAVVASALFLDAYRNRMTGLPPHDVFESLYQTFLDDCKDDFDYPNLSNEIKSRFINAANECQKSGLDVQEIHRSLIHSSHLKHLLRSCSFCVIKKPNWTLDCGHLLCQGCIISHGLHDESYRFSLTSCPVCERLNHSSFVIKPPTAATIALELNGTTPSKILHFLKELRRAVGVSLQDCFDVVIGSGVGNFFVITALLEGWDLSDCSYHQKHLSRRVRLKGNRVNFGKSLSWDLTRTRLYNNKTVFLDFGKKSLLYQGQTGITESDVMIRYKEATYDQRLLNHTAYSLIAALFYIEMETYPSFYRNSESCTIKVYCRIPAGSALLNLVYRLHRSNAMLCYSESFLTEQREALCGDEVMSRCERLQEFRKDVAVTISSPQDVIRLCLETDDGRWPIGKCPYRIESLIYDQTIGQVRR